MIQYILGFILLAISSLIYYKVADRFNIIDKPNQRSSHTQPTIRGGGILFFFALMTFFIFNGYPYPYFFVGLFLLAIVSFLDDLYTLSSNIRFPIQLIAMLFLLYQVEFPFLPVWFFITVLFIGLASLNIFNFMDGVNGITGLYALSSILGLFMINQQEQIFNNDLFIYMTFAIIIFGFYNFRKKALMFAGDIGSITIGFFIIFIVAKMLVVLNASLLVLAFGVYGIDSGGTMIYRKFFTNEKWTEPHRHHIYQKLVDRKGWSHLKVSLYYAIIQLLFGLLLFYTYHLPEKTQWLLAIPITLIVFLIYVLLFRWLEKININ